jgi:hypothetical protein
MIVQPLIQSRKSPRSMGRLKEQIVCQMKAKKEYTETIMHSCGHEVEYKTLGYKMNGKGKTFDSVR